MSSSFFEVITMYHYQNNNKCDKRTIKLTSVIELENRAFLRSIFVAPSTNVPYIKH